MKNRVGEREKGGKGKKDKIFFSHSPTLPFSHSIFSSPHPLIGLLFFALIIGCQSIPAPPRTSTSISKPESSNPKLRLLGVNFIDRLGKAGSGNGEFIRPMGIALDTQGLIYVADSGNHRVEVIDSDGNFRWEFGRFGRRLGEFDSPSDLTVDGQFQLYVSDTENNRIQRANLIDRIFSVFVGENLSPSTKLSIVEEVRLDRPYGIAADKNGDVYISDTWNHRFLKFDLRGAVKFKIGSFGWSKEQFRYPTDITVSEQGHIFVTDRGNNRIQKFDFSGSQILEWGQSGTERGEFKNPWGISKDRQNNIFIVDRGDKSEPGNKRVQVFDSEGLFLTEFGAGILSDPVDVAVDKSGQVYVTDSAANDIKVFKAIYGN